MSSWREEFAEKLAELRELEYNWNEEGGLPVDPKAEAAAWRFMDFFGSEERRVQVVPLNDGGLQLEWHYSPIHIEIEFAADGEGYYDYEGATVWSTNDEEEK